MNTKINTKRFSTLMLLSASMSGFTAHSIDQYIKHFKNKGAWVNLIPALMGIAGVFTTVDVMLKE